MTIKETLEAILSKKMSVEEALSKSTPEQREEVEIALAYIGELHKASDCAYKGEMCKFDKNGQWKIEKGDTFVKEPPTLNYGDMNKKPDYKSIEANAPTINYGEMNKPSNQKATWKQTSTDASKKAAWAKINASRNKLAGKGLKKGVLEDDEVKNPERMVAKEEILEKPPVSEAQRKAMWAAAGGHSNLGIPQNVGKDFAESDPGGKLPKKVKKGEEPHKDDPHHEAKEVDKAKKIKEKAEELLDMHKK